MKSTRINKIGCLLALALLFCACAGQAVPAPTAAPTAAQESDMPSATTEAANSPVPTVTREPQTDADPIAEPTPDDGTPIVFFTSDISAAGLVKIFEALKWQPSGAVAVKISTGEPPRATICVRN